MKKLLPFIALLAAATMFVGCEKFELEDHCPEEEQNSTSYGDPQDYRVNDDSDSEESGSYAKSLNGGGDIDRNDTASDFGSSDGSEGDDDDNGDDLINDDSDNEDEGGQPRDPNDNDVSNGNEPGLK